MEQILSIGITNAATAAVVAVAAAGLDAVVIAAARDTLVPARLSGRHDDALVDGALAERCHQCGKDSFEHGYLLEISMRL